ncbi:MAG TPA: winged helix-turn-helix domain-containing protein [Blastocatellia bacterium]|nr:winged helix-turn-helix domain-containing protein [Blastocatellia bacterium]
MSLTTKRFYEFSAFRLDADQRLLLRDGEVVPLTPKAIDLLVALVENSGHVLTKDELMKRVWPDSFVEEANLSHHVFTLRKALGEDRDGAKYIETIPRRGYRFVASVSQVQDESDEIVVAEHSRTHIVIEQSQETIPDVEAKVSEDKRLKERTAIGIKPLLLAGSTAVIVLGLLSYFWITNNNEKNRPPNIKSIAVLPFRPLVAESHDEYLELGMADTLITRLGSLKQIDVRPTSAVRKYTDINQDAVAAGRELQVDSVLDGGIQRQGDRLRVTIRLLNVKDGTTLWADKFDERYTDIFVVQDVISERLAGVLSLKLSGEGEGLLNKRYTANVEAYQLFLRGRYYWSNFDPQDLETSIKFFNAALEKDPTYALAYSGLANAYSVMGIYGPLLPKDAYPKSRQAALKALQLDDNLAAAHASLGAVMVFYDWDWTGAELEFKRAIELDPANIDAHTLYGYCLQAKGRADEAVVEMRRAQEIDPVWAVTNNDVANALYLARRYDEAIEHAQDSLKLKPNRRLFCIMGQTYLEKGMPEQAISAFRQALNIQENHVFAQAGLGYTYARLGKRSEALEAIRRLKNNASRLNAIPHSIAVIYGALGEKDQALAWLEKAYQDRNPYMWHIKLDPRFDSLRSDERFTAFLRRINL